MDIKELKKMISSLEDKSFNNYVCKEKNAEYFLEMGKCNAYGNVLELIKELENKQSKNLQLQQTGVIRSDYIDESPETRININKFNDGYYDGKFRK